MKQVIEKSLLYLFFSLPKDTILVKQTFFFRQQKKRYMHLKIPKRACSELFQIFGKILSKFLVFLKLTAKKIYKYKEIFFLVYVAKSISFEVISFLKISTFAAFL